MRQRPARLLSTLLIAGPSDFWAQCRAKYYPGYDSLVPWRLEMKVVIIGGTGLIGRKLATKLQSGGHDVVAASPSTGVNSLTGEGLKEVLTGANVVVDVTNSPSFEDNAVLDFFRSSTGHLLSAAAAAGVSHYIALSVVGSIASATADTCVQNASRKG